MYDKDWNDLNIQGYVRLIIENNIDQMSIHKHTVSFS